MDTTNQNNTQNTENNAQNTQNVETNNGGTGTPAINYDKIQQMLNGTLAAKETTALKAYFKQQGLSQEEVETAIADFKANQKTQNPDQTEQLNAANARADAAEARANAAEIRAEALSMAAELSVDANTVNYLLKMADTSAVCGEDGKLNNAELKKALETVLTDLPQLKITSTNNTGYRPQKVGAGKPENGGKSNTKPRNSKEIIDGLFKK